MATNVTANDLVEYWESDSVPTLPDYTKLTSQGFATDGNPMTGLVATLPGAAWFNLIAAMRVSVIKAAGLTPTTTPDPLQFLQALQSMAWMTSGNISYSMLKSDVTATKAEAKAGAKNDRFVTPLSLQAVIDVICPPGMISFFHATDVPEGWLLGNGAAVSRTTYARLFAKIGTKYGAGDGLTTFNLPNLMGRVLQGTTNTGEVGTYLEASLPNIQGTTQCVGYVARNWQAGLNADGPFSGMQRWEYLFSIGSDANDGSVIEFNANLDNALYNGQSLRLPALQTLPCIRY